jgi:hypothetical protein
MTYFRLKNLVQQYHSELCIQAYERAGQKPPNTSYFCLATTILVMDGFALNRAERQEVLRAELAEIAKINSIGPGHPAWENALQVFTQANEANRACFPEAGLNWETLRARIGDEDTRLLEEFGDRVRALLKDFRREESGSWPIPFIRAIGVKFIHQLWLRGFGDNIRETLALGWLLNGTAKSGD